MIELISLTNQLDNLNIVYDEAIARGVSMIEVKKVYQQIKEVEKLIAEQKTKMASA